MKSRRMKKGEVLFEDQTKAEFLYFLIAGSLRIEKEVVITSENFWPIDFKQWEETVVEQIVQFKVSEIEKFELIGANELMRNRNYPVRLVAACDGTTVLMIHRRELNIMFSQKDKERILEEQERVTFPTLE